MAKSVAQPNQSLIDGLAVLRALAVAGGPVGSREMARRLGLEPTRVNRLLGTLAAIGVARQTADRKYVPGPAMHVLSVQAMYGSGLLIRAEAALQSLERFKLHAAVGVLWQNQVVYLSQASQRSVGKSPFSVNAPYPAEHSGVGVPLLAAMSDADVKSLYSEAPRSGMRSLLARLQACRDAGYAFLPADEHRSEAALGVAAGSPAFAGVALAGQIKPAEVPELIEALKHAAAIVGAEETAS
jgi:DNA-binding IclR family transcriptional regulator